MKTKVFLIALCSGIIQAQPPHRFGAIDGTPIDERDLNVPRETAIVTYLRQHAKQPSSEAEAQSFQDELQCRRLRGVVQEAAEKRAKAELGIFSTDAEIAAERKNVVARAPDIEGQKKRYRERLQALIDGLSAVYDKGQDPDQTYQQLVAPHGVTKGDWAGNVYLGKDKQERQKLVQQLAAATPEAFDRAADTYDPRPLIENQKLEAAVDVLLAASDPKFKADLNELNASVTHPTPNHTARHGSAIVLDYVEQKRAAWWKAETGKMNVTLSDQSLYAACGLAAMGVTVPAH